MSIKIDAIRVHDQEHDQTWEIPSRPIKRIIADVSERWVANVIVNEAVCRELIDVPWLEPVRSGGKYVLSLCAIFMRHAAPDWAPLKSGPPSRNCALRIACVDTRTGEPAVWVDDRYSDSILVGALAKLGFPAVHPKLRVELGRDFYDHRQLIMQTTDHCLSLRLIEYPEIEREASGAFESAADFEGYFGAGVRSYGPTAKAGHASLVDLHKQSDNHFEAMDQYFGFLRTKLGNWPVDSVYRTRNGTYEWCYEGEVSF